MKLPTLYSKTSLGQIQVWEIEVNGDAFSTKEGILGGKMTESAPTVCLPKNEGKKNATTGSQQAEKEAVAKHEKKKKTGGYWEDINDVDKVKFTEPMLAESLKDFENKVQYPCMVDKKYNGLRVVAKSDNMFTRTGEIYKTIPHVRSSIKHLFDNNPNLILDGEGYNHEYRFRLNSLMKILRTTKDKKITTLLLNESEQKVKYYVYDGINFTVDGVEITKETPCIERREALKKFLKDVNYVIVADYSIAQNRAEIDVIYGGYIADGYEGAMVRNSKSPYQFKRTTDLLKMKPLDDSEGIITSVNRGIGNSSNLAATATLSWVADKHQVFDATFMGEVPDRENILVNEDQWVGKKVKFFYNGVTGLGIPNYARINPEDCSPIK